MTQATIEHAPVQPGENGSHPAEPRVKVLLVDDRAANLLALEAVLEPLELDLVRAGSGYEALRCVLRDDFAVILMDVQMAGLDGFETAALIKQREKSRSIPIIFLTAINKTDRCVFQGYSAGAVDYIFKPFDPEILKSKVAVFVDLHRKSAEIERQSELLRRKNALMEADLELAREIQQAFLPQQYLTLPRAVGPTRGALRFFHRYVPTVALGGDFSDILVLSDTRAAIFVCDVMGHGVRAALVTAIIRGLIEELMPAAGEPGAFLTGINRGLLAILRRTRTPMFASAFYLVADVASGRMCYASAGHPSPLRARRGAAIGGRDGGGPDAVACVVEQLPADGGTCGPALGVFEDADYPSTECSLAANDLLVIFTDGLYEVGNSAGAEYDQEQLLASVRRHVSLPPDQLLDELLREIRDFAGSHQFEDDVCLVGMEVTGEGLPPACA